MTEEGTLFAFTCIVREEDTAIRQGSGALPVLATPRLVALMENAAMRLVAEDLAEDETTVGGKIEVVHLRPSAVGARIETHARLEKVEGRKLTFSVCAFDGPQIIGEGTHVRFIVNCEKFMSVFH